MGGTGSRQYVAPMLNDPDDKIGSKKVVHNGCAMIGSESNFLADKIPSNGEYKWTGAGDYCHYCSDAPGNLTTSPWCDGTCCPILGGQGVYERTAYRADPKQCCITGARTIGDVTCDPDYQDTKNSTCDNHLSANCTGANLFDNERCRNWCAKNKEGCQENKEAYCNDTDNPLSPACKTFCSANPKKCDASAVKFCAEPANVDDPFCACINSFVPPHVSRSHDPVCWDRKCQIGGYQTTAMGSASDCKIVSCDVYYTIDGATRANIASNHVVQKCGTDDEKKTDNLTGGIDSSGTPVVDSTKTLDAYDKAEIGIVVVFSLCVIGVVAFTFWQRLLRKNGKGRRAFHYTKGLAPDLLRRFFK